MKKNSKKVLLMGILVVVMIIVVTGVSLAFFNYTRTGSANTLSVGRISFNHTQDGKIELSNVFPTSSTNLNSTNSDTVTINITGDTTYSEGIEYKVTLDQVNNTINGKEVPISIRATATNLGTEDSNYYTNRENKTKIYKLNSEGDAYNGKYIAVGYIPSGATGVNGSIDITAFIDTNKVVISDTYDGNETDLMGTTYDFVAGREVFTTEEWNSFVSTPLSFKVKVEANEGIWVMGSLQNVIVSNSSKTTFIKNYNDIIIENPTFTTQDTVGTNNNKQDVYYYTGLEWAKSGCFYFILMQIFSIISIFLESSLRFLAIQCESEKMFKLSKLIGY